MQIHIHICNFVFLLRAEQIEADVAAWIGA